MMDALKLVEPRTKPPLDDQFRPATLARPEDRPGQPLRGDAPQLDSCAWGPSTLWNVLEALQGIQPGVLAGDWTGADQQDVEALGAQFEP